MGRHDVVVYGSAPVAAQYLQLETARLPSPSSCGAGARGAWLLARTLVACPLLPSCNATFDIAVTRCRERAPKTIQSSQPFLDTLPWNFISDVNKFSE